jgi:hypothetical protein
LLQRLLDATRNYGPGHYGARARLARFTARAGEQFDDIGPRYHANRDALLVAYYDKGGIGVHQDLGGNGDQRLLTQHHQSSSRRIKNVLDQGHKRFPLSCHAAVTVLHIAFD